LSLTVLSEGDRFLPISALEHLEYCERQCALIHVHGEWVENGHTAHGQALHTRVDSGVSATVKGVKTFRAVEVRSLRLGLYGKCDAVERRDRLLVPVEYKKGAQKRALATHIQLAAQVIALEEMTGTNIPEAIVFHAKVKRRETVAIDGTLRTRTEIAAKRLHSMLAAHELPPAGYEPYKCDQCSLITTCLPRSMENQVSLRSFAGGPSG
jgi:CRISPR-associated exonuclease Cas4